MFPYAFIYYKKVLSMKRVMKMSVLAWLLALGSAFTYTASAQYDRDYDDDDYGQQGEVSYQTFYDELSPHGRWMDYPGHGYVWIPDAGPDFRPYSTNGHWVWTEDYEWMWVSDYDWGWAPFHYGRWDHDPYYGWFWVPGYEWSPAWVAWRDGGDYYGWAPLRPGISISINFNIGSYRPPYDFWCFTPRRYITHRNVFSYCLPRTRNLTIINQTTIINNYNYRGNIWRTGPRRASVEIYTGRINPVRFRSADRPGRTVFRQNEVSVYRPRVRQDNNQQFAPRSVERFERRGNDNRVGRNDNNFRRNDSRVDRNNRNENANPRSNNLPRREFDRRDNPVRSQRTDNNGNSPVRPRFERTERNTENRPQGNNDRRVIRPTDRPQRNTNPGNNNRQFERRNVENRPSANNPSRQQPSGNFERPQRQQPQRAEPQRRTPQRMESSRPSQPRQFERRNEGGNNRQSGNGNGRSRRGND